MPPGRRTRRFWIAITLCLVLLTAIAMLVAQRRSVARALIDSQLRSLGLEEIGHDVERFGLNEFGVRNFHIGNDRGLFVDRIDARYSLSSLLAGKLESLSVSGVRLNGAFQDGQLTFGALDSALTGGGADGGAAPLALPARSIAIEDVEVIVETPEGPLTGGFAANLRELDDRRISADAKAHARHPLFEAIAEFDLAGTPKTFDGDLTIELRSISPAGHRGRMQAEGESESKSKSKLEAESQPEAESQLKRGPTGISLTAEISGTEERIDIALAPLPFRYAP